MFAMCLLIFVVYAELIEVKILDIYVQSNFFMCNQFIYDDALEDRNYSNLRVISYKYSILICRAYCKTTIQKCIKSISDKMAHKFYQKM